MAFVDGSSNSEVINLFDGVTFGADTIWAYGGDDTISGLGGDDQIKGGGGADAINGGGGSDTAFYSDSAVGVSVSLITGTGLGGTAQGDTLTNVENLSGSAYADLLIGDGGANMLSGSSGNDTLKGGGGTDMLDGGNGDDLLRGGTGADILSGGAGNDTIVYIDSPGAITVFLFGAALAWGGDAEDDNITGVENVTGSGFNDELRGDDNANVLHGLNGNDILKGGGGTDTLYGGNGHDDLRGEDGADTLRGEAGNDYLDGGAGIDTMIGGLGDDVYIVDVSNDGLVENAGQGVDTVRANMNYVLPDGADIEILRLADPTGVANLNLRGNASGNQIVGNDGNNNLNGGGGTDQLVGRNGNDVYTVDSLDDEVVESGGQGIDRVVAVASWTLTEGADVEILEPWDDDGVSAIDLTGNSSGNVVRGNPGNNVLNGRDGNDELTGYGGEDSFLFDTALDAAFNVDVITDFNVTDDTIRLDDAIFAAFATGGLAAERFVVGAAAQDASDCIIYDSDTGALYYDSDGNGDTAAVQFAELSAGLALTHLDFLVV